MTAALRASVFSSTARCHCHCDSPVCITKNLPPPKLQLIFLVSICSKFSVFLCLMRAFFYFVLLFFFVVLFASSEPQWCGNGYIADELNYDVENSALEKYVIQSFGKWRHWINCYGQNCVKTQLRHLSPWFGLSWLLFFYALELNELSALWFYLIQKFSWIR